MRVLHELPSFERATFITLTYAPEYITENYSLQKTALQKFFKRLRKRLDGKIKIKYFACGEYGGKFGRPHYHIILMGLGNNKTHQELIQDCWPFGQIDFGTVSPASVKYTTKYIQKKLVGPLGKEAYEEQNREPPFQLVSQGFGLNYAIQNKANIVENGYLTVDGYKKTIPKYYQNKLKLDKAPIKLKAFEKQFAIAKEFLIQEGLATYEQQNLQITDLSYKGKLYSFKIPLDFTSDKNYYYVHELEQILKLTNILIADKIAQGRNQWNETLKAKERTYENMNDEIF